MRNKAKVLGAITHRVKDGKDVYEAYCGTDVTGRAVRFSRNSEKELRAAVEDFYKRYRVAGALTMELDARKVIDAKNAIYELVRGGYKISLTETARFYMERNPPSEIRTTLGEAFEKYVATFDEETQAAHVRTIRSRVGNWVKAAGPNRPLPQVERAHLEEYLKATAKTVKTYNNVLNYVKTFMRWCCSADTVGLKVSPFEGIKARPMAYVEPEFVTVDAAEAVARRLEFRDDRDAMAYMALSFFSGIRFEEIVRLKENAGRDVNLAEGAVRVSKPKGWTNGIRPRMVELLPNAMSWLDRAGGAETVASADFVSARARVSEAARALGVEWPHNAGRHSFITYHVAAFGEPSKTEALAGTSAQMRARNYMGLATRAQGQRYFSIMPAALPAAGS